MERVEWSGTAEVWRVQVWRVSKCEKTKCEGFEVLLVTHTPLQKRWCGRKRKEAEGVGGCERQLGAEVERKGTRRRSEREKGAGIFHRPSAEHVSPTVRPFVRRSVRPSI